LIAPTMRRQSTGSTGRLAPTSDVVAVENVYLGREINVSGLPERA
jgi:hypothetical protein